MDPRHLVATALLVAATVACAASVWERSPWDNSPAKQETAQPTAVRQSSKAAPAPNTFIDPRDDQPYKTINANGQTWFAENLNFEHIESSCYSNRNHCKKDGRLYTWHIAKHICPPGTRLPTLSDWQRALGSIEKTLTMTGFRAFNGDYYDYSNTGAYWTADEKDDYADYAFFIKWKFREWQKEAFYKDQANSVRCIVEGSKTSRTNIWGNQ